MSDLKTQQIVNFIGNLPQYHADDLGEYYVAVRITDGTVVLPADNEGDDEQGIIRVRWQGDGMRESRVIATRFAEFSIVEAAHFYTDTGESPSVQAVVIHLFDHFTLKTGYRISYGEYAKAGEGLKALAGFGTKVAGNIAASVAQKTIGF